MSFDPGVEYSCIPCGGVTSCTTTGGFIANTLPAYATGSACELPFFDSEWFCCETLDCTVTSDQICVFTEGGGGGGGGTSTHTGGGGTSTHHTGGGTSTHTGGGGGGGGGGTSTDPSGNECAAYRQQCYQSCSTTPQFTCSNSSPGVFEHTCTCSSGGGGGGSSGGGGGIGLPSLTHGQALAVYIGVPCVLLLVVGLAWSFFRQHQKHQAKARADAMQMPLYRPQRGTGPPGFNTAALTGPPPGFYSAGPPHGVRFAQAPSAGFQSGHPREGNMYLPPAQHPQQQQPQPQSETQQEAQ